jgi:3-methylcrotonyl-CoA carboxylase alpha subunit
VAAGEPLPLKQNEIKLEGHAVEARLYAEDPERNFLPSTGKLLAFGFSTGKGIRTDAGVETGDEITPFYDPLIAKVIAHGDTRQHALARLAQALEITAVVGPRSNLDFLVALCRAPGFRAGDFDTGFIDAHLAELGAVPQPVDLGAVARGVGLLIEQERRRLAGERNAEAPASPWDSEDGFQLSGERQLHVPVIADGKSLIATVRHGAAGYWVTVDGVAMTFDADFYIFDGVAYVRCTGRQTKVSLRDLALDEAGDAEHSGVVRAPMHGKVLAILVEQGAAVRRGQRLAIIEAMKMEHTLTAPIDGTVAEVAVEKDAQVAEGGKIMAIAGAGAATP